MRKILVALADQHAGHKLGLMNPDVVLYDEDEHGQLQPWTPRPTATQEYLWRSYLQDLNNVVQLARGDPLILLNNGDLCHGDKHPSQLVSTRKSDQIMIAVANMQPWLALLNLQALRVVQGTGAHEFLEGSAAILIAEYLKAQHPALNVRTLVHSRLSLEGCVVDYAHHGASTGMRQWTQGQQLRWYVKSLLNDDVLMGRVPPRIVLRAHYHTYCRETVRLTTREKDGTGHTWECDAFVLPAYCGLGEYGRQATRSAHEIGSGLVAFEIQEGVLVGVHPFVRVEDLRTEETL